jgi:hypothetical protein
MSGVRPPPKQVGATELRALSRDIAEAGEPQIKRIVAHVDAMANRGAADALIEPLRQRLRLLRPPRPLRLARLMFYPLDPLIVPGSRWLPGRTTIPRSALTAITERVRQAMGPEAQAIEAEIAGKTTADAGLITALGRPLWPAVARILLEANVPEGWEATGLGDVAYRPLADSIAALLTQAAPLDRLCAETANGLLPPNPEKVGFMLRHIAGTCPAALPMLIALLLVRLPQAAASIRLDGGPDAAAIEMAFNQATDRVLRQLEEEDGTEALIAAGKLADAGAAAARIAKLLEQLDTGHRTPQRREQLRSLRQRLDASSRARFTLGLQEEFLMPLQNLGNPPDPAAIRDLEAAARGLRVLEMEARAVGSGASYDFLLRQATATVKDGALRDRLAVVDQARLVEVLAGPDAAFEMMGLPP